MIIVTNTSRSSPNHSSRNGHAISMLVLHSTAGGAQSSLNWLCSPASGVSSHFVITKAGTIYRLVNEERAAWHAGRASWHGVTDCNAASLGIELENANDGRDPYPPAQLSSCRDLCRSLVARYHIARGDVVRHLDIAMPHGRKTDPANFPDFDAFVGSMFTDAPPGSSQPPPDKPLHSYRVKASCTGGASIRAYPRVNAAILGRLHAGDAWEGEEIEASTATYVKGFGSSKVWVRSMDMRWVWSGLLERVRE
jgi:hypothetical protein